MPSHRDAKQLGTWSEIFTVVFVVRSNTYAEQTEISVIWSAPYTGASRKKTNRGFDLDQQQCLSVDKSDKIAHAL